MLTEKEKRFLLSLVNGYARGLSVADTNDLNACQTLVKKLEK